MADQELASGEIYTSDANDNYEPVGCQNIYCDDYIC